MTGHITTCMEIALCLRPISASRVVKTSSAASPSTTYAVHAARAPRTLLGDLGCFCLKSNWAELRSFVEDGKICGSGIRAGLFSTPIIYEGECTALVDWNSTYKPFKSTVMYKDIERFSELSDGLLVRHPIHPNVLAVLHRFFQGCMSFSKLSSRSDEPQVPHWTRTWSTRGTWLCGACGAKYGNCWQISRFRQRRRRRRSWKGWQNPSWRCGKQLFQYLDICIPISSTATWQTLFVPSPWIHIF